MKLNQLRDVLAVAERGSLRSAARHLGLAQPAITRSIQELERELGTTLFERRANGMTLTVVGEAFVRRAASIQLELQRTRDEVEQLRGGVTGTVAVALSTATHVALLPRVLAPFRRRYPDVRIRIVETLFPAIEADLRDGRIDFYVGPLGEDVQPGELLIEPLFPNRRVVVGRHGHALSGATTLAELVEAQWVTTSVTLVSEVELNPVFERFGLPSPRIAVQAETALSMIVIAASSDLLAMLPQQWLAFISATSMLTHIAVREELAAPTICSVTRSRLPLTPAARHFADLFQKAAANHARSLGAAHS